MVEETRVLHWFERYGRVVIRRGLLAAKDKFFTPPVALVSILSRAKAFARSTDISTGIKNSIFEDGMLDPHGREQMLGNPTLREASAGKLLFVSWPGDAETGPSVFGMASDGTSRQRLTWQRGVDFDPAWSPDGTRIAFVSVGRATNEACEIYVMNADGSQVQRVTHSPAETVCTSPSWAPTGDQLVYTRISKEKDSEEFSEIMIHDLGRGTSRRLRSGATCPSWSPDGQSILFVQLKIGFLVDGPLYRIRRDGTGLKRIIKETVTYRAAWSPDGKQICYSRVGKGLRATLWLANADGSRQRQLTRHTSPIEDVSADEMWTDVADREPVWSKDGKYIYFARWHYISAWGPPQRAEIYRLELSSGTLTRLSPEGCIEFIGGGASIAPFVTPLPDGD